MSGLIEAVEALKDSAVTVRDALLLDSVIAAIDQHEAKQQEVLKEVRNALVNGRHYAKQYGAIFSGCEYNNALASLDRLITDNAIQEIGGEYAKTKRCPHCGNVVRGHPNKRFCGQRCKDRFHNTRNPRGYGLLRYAIDDEGFDNTSCQNEE